MEEKTLRSPRAESFEFQKWPLYERALEFVAQGYRVCAELPKDSATGLRDQLRRASQSIPLNIAEGCSRYTARDKANFFRIARGSVFECVAILDVAKKLELAGRDLREPFKNAGNARPDAFGADQLRRRREIQEPQTRFAGLD
jgi:four helix bundle protein